MQTPPAVAAVPALAHCGAVLSGSAPFHWSWSAAEGEVGRTYGYVTVQELQWLSHHIQSQTSTLIPFSYYTNKSVGWRAGNRTEVEAWEQDWGGDLGTRLGWRAGNKTGLEGWEQGWGGGLGIGLGWRPGNQVEGWEQDYYRICTSSKFGGISILHGNTL